MISFFITFKKCLYVKSIFLCVALVSSINTYAQPQIFTPKEEVQNYFFTAIFSPDGSKIMTTNNNGYQQLWEGTSGKLLNAFKLQNRYFHPTFDNSGTNILTEENLDSVIIFRNVYSGEITNSIKIPCTKVDFAKFSPNGKKIAFSQSNHFFIWDTDLKKIINYRKEEVAIRDFKFSEDSKLISISLGSYNRKAILLDLEKNIEIGSFIHESDKAPTFISKFILATIEAHLVNLWNSSNGQLIKSIDSEMKGRSIIDFSMCQDTSKLIVHYSGNKFIIWDINSGEKLKTHFNFNPYLQRKFVFNKDGTKILAFWHPSSKNTILYDSYSGTVIHVFPENFHSANFSNDGKRMLFLNSDIIHVFNLDTEKIVSKIKNYTIDLVSFTKSPNSSLITLKTKAKKIISFNTKSGYQNGIFPYYFTDNNGDSFYENYLVNVQKNNIISLDKESDFFEDSPFNNLVIWNLFTHDILFKSDRFYSCTGYSPNGEYYFIGDVEGNLTVRNAKNNKFYKQFCNPDMVITKAFFAPSGKHILCEVSEKLLKLYDLHSGKLFKEFKIDIKEDKYSFSPDGAIFILERKYQIEVINLKSNEITLYNKSDISSIIFNSDCSKMIQIVPEFLPPPNEDLLYYFYGYGNIYINVIDLSNKQIINIIKDDTLYSKAKFSPDDSQILIYNNRYAKVFDIHKGEIVTKIIWENRNIEFADFDSTSNRIITIGSDHCVRFWDIIGGKELIAYYPLDGGDWILMHPSGVFDTSKKGQSKLYFKSNHILLPLEELKNHYYQNNLWNIVMNGNQNQLKKVYQNEIFIKKIPNIKLRYISKLLINKNN